MIKLWDRFYCWLFQIKLGWILTPERMQEIHMQKMICEEVDKIVSRHGLAWCNENLEEFDELLCCMVTNRMNGWPLLGLKWPRPPDPASPITDGPRLADLKVNIRD